MVVSVIEHNNKVATKFVSKDLSIGHLISRQQILIILYVIISIVKLKYAGEWPILNYINPIWLFLLVRAPIRDSVESIANQGIQISCSGGLLLLPGTLNDALFSSIRFIPQDEIEDIFINEAFKGLQVIYYLAVLVNTQDKLQVLFEKTLPRLNDLVPIYRNIHSNMFADSDFGKKHQQNISLKKKI